MLTPALQYQLALPRNEWLVRGRTVGFVTGEGFRTITRGIESITNVIGLTRLG